MDRGAMTVILFMFQVEDGGFVARAADYPIFTQGDGIVDLVENVKEAIECHFNV